MNCDVDPSLQDGSSVTCNKKRAIFIIMILKIMFFNNRVSKIGSFELVVNANNWAELITKNEIHNKNWIFY